ncbi:unnamed protein product [Heligmosomoides polygyrus]|uniref:Reverse transcriptase domain-containing protein n=1 Tax=Heligmosomoides polygyrus TaxID=6339 RepID=A0A183FH06_HELPZ|nr:unnamed protein product [Heligmosomoides polygyrus]
MKPRKATGPDDLVANLWKSKSWYPTKWLATFFNQLPSDCLLSHSMKILERIVDGRIRDIVKLSENQCGFAAGCGTVDAIHTVQDGVHNVEAIRFRILKNTLTIIVTRTVSETTMTAVSVFRSTYVPIKVTSEYDDIFRRYLGCLLIKQSPKLILGLIGAASLRCICREEVIESLLSGDNDLHQSTVKALDAYNRVTKSLGDDYPDTTAELPRLLRCTEIDSSTLQCFYRHEQPVNVPTFSVATRVLLTLRDPRILSTLTRLCECVSAPVDAEALSRKT